MERVEVSENELIQALMSATVSEENPHGALTMNEIREATGMPVTRIRIELHRLKDEGKLGVTKVTQINLAGYAQGRAAYYVKNGGGMPGEQGYAETAG